MLTMVDFKRKAELKISELLDNIHKSLTKHQIFTDEQRELPADEYEIITNLVPDSFLHKILLRVLVIETYTTGIMNQLGAYEQLNGMLTATLQSFNDLRQSVTKNGETLEKYNQSRQLLVKSIKIIQEMFPKSEYLQKQTDLMNSIKLEFKVDDEIVERLKMENEDLRKKLQVNEMQILKMENKLTKLLKEHEGCERGKVTGGGKQCIQLREQLSYKQGEIEKMNEEFSFQIQKYNTVFETMKQELDELKAYQNINLIQKIEHLETTIVRLEEQNQLNQLIIKQLRSDNILNNANMYSPKRLNREYNRYQR